MTPPKISKDKTCFVGPFNRHNNGFPGARRYLDLGSAEVNRSLLIQELIEFNLIHIDEILVELLGTTQELRWSFLVGIGVIVEVHS
jgi:hypothetical protein